MKFAFLQPVILKSYIGQLFYVKSNQIKSNVIIDKEDLILNMCT